MFTTRYCQLLAFSLKALQSNPAYTLKLQSRHITLCKPSFFDPIDLVESRQRRKSKTVGVAQTSLVKQGYPFDSIPNELKTRENFEKAIDQFKKRNAKLRGHVDFIYAALKRMQNFNVHENLEVYKKLIDIFPKGKMKVRNIFQAESHYYPRHQDCCITVMDQMGFFGVCADKEFYKKVEAVFGNESTAMTKMKSHMYWLPKFKNCDPNPVPKQLPNSEIELAKIIINRICRDAGNVTRVNFSEEIDGAKEDTWIVSGQSPLQKDHIKKHADDEPMYIDGPFRAWAGKKYLSYFMLTAEPNRKKFYGDVKPENHNWHTAEEWARLDNKYTTEFPESRKQLMLTPTIHEQPDGTILGLTITGSGSKESLAYWLMFLQKNNPRLTDIPVVFRIVSATGGELAPIEGSTRINATKNMVETEDASL